MPSKKPSWIITALTSRGYKLTKPRERIVATLEKAKGIFSAQQLNKKLRNMDTVSIYRTLELLENLDIIHPVITLKGVQFYELHGNTHHHHVICTSCQRSDCLDCSIPPLTVRGFDQIHHTFIATGLCHQCARKMKPPYGRSSKG